MQARYQRLTTISIHALLAESDQSLRHDIHGASFLSTLSLRRATPPPCLQVYMHHISIHALLAESDAGDLIGVQGQTDFYPRSPCGERLVIHVDFCGNTFYFYPRSPCGERRLVQARYQRLTTISIHALLAESDSS